MSRPRPHLIETVRVRHGMAPLWYLHLRRLAASCKALGVPLPRTLEAPHGGGDRICRLEVSPGGIAIAERPIVEPAAVRLAVAATCHRPYSHKTTDRAAFDAALSEARAACMDDALLLSAGRGFVAEAARWSIFWWEGNRVAGPPLDLAILPGVARARLAEYAGPVLERRAVLAEILNRQPFVANAARGVVAISAIGGHAIPADGRTAELAAGFWP